MYCNGIILIFYGYGHDQDLNTNKTVFILVVGPLRGGGGKPP